MLLGSLTEPTFGRSNPLQGGLPRLDMRPLLAPVALLRGAGAGLACPFPLWIPPAFRGPPVRLFMGVGNPPTAPNQTSVGFSDVGFVRSVRPRLAAANNKFTCAVESVSVSRIISSGSVALESKQFSDIAAAWVGLIRSWGPDCGANTLFPSSDTLLEFLRGSSPSTLQRHWRAWQHWVIFCDATGGAPESPCFDKLRLFLQETMKGKSLRAFSSAGNFVVHRLQVNKFQAVLDRCAPIIRSRALHRLSSTKEATPWPLELQVALEEATMDAPTDAGACFFGALCLCAQGGLRYSDAQRVRIDEVVEDATSVRGFVFRSKSRRRGFAFGVTKLGVTGANWPSRWLAAARVFMPGADFTIATKRGGLASYGKVRSFLQELIPEERVTPHSAKPTWLSWGALVGATDNERLCQGHHKPADRTMLTLYSRNDVAPQLQLQVKVLIALSSGWRPPAVSARGACVVQRGEDSLNILKLVPMCFQELLPEHWSQTRAVSIGKSAVEPSDDIPSDSDSDEGLSESDTEGSPCEADSWRTAACQRLLMRCRGIVHAGVASRPACGASLSRDTAILEADEEFEDLEVSDALLAPCGHSACLARLS